MKNYTNHNPEENDPAFREAAFPADVEIVPKDLVSKHFSNDINHVIKLLIYTTAQKVWG